MGAASVSLMFNPSAVAGAACSTSLSLPGEAAQYVVTPPSGVTLAFPNTVFRFNGLGQPIADPGGGLLANQIITVTGTSARIYDRASGDRPCLLGVKRGATLIEVIMFMVIVGIAVAAVMSVFVGTTRASAEPLIRKQALAIAESLLEEVRLMPFTFCDPDDPAATTAIGAGRFCGARNVGAGGRSETRYAPLTPFDNVNDYNGFAMAGGILDITDPPIPGLGAYSATVAVTPFAFGGIAAADVLLITVTVTGPGGTAVTFDGIRTRHAPTL